MKTVLIHGLGQDASAWKDVIPLLPDINVLTMDLSELIGSGTWQELSNGFAARIDSLEEPVLLCGISLGAVLALNYAAGNPGKVRSMLLIAPQYKMPVLLLKFQALLFRLMPQSSFAGSGLSKKQFIALTTDMARLDFTQALNNITCPVITACGERDSANSRASRRLAELLDCGEFAKIPGAGHEANTDAPEFTAQLITRIQARG